MSVFQRSWRDLFLHKFCRHELDQGVPDDSTPGRFRARSGGRLEAILDEIMAQPEAQQVVLSEGRIPKAPIAPNGAILLERELFKAQVGL